MKDDKCGSFPKILEWGSAAKCLGKLFRWGRWGVKVNLITPIANCICLCACLRILDFQYLNSKLFIYLWQFSKYLQPKWNNALLEMFRIDYVGTSPYITCFPFLYHHRLGPKDRFLILSSDGLYQYFTNEEAVSEVELFITLQPEGDPAQHLVEEVLFRAAKKAGNLWFSNREEILVLNHLSRTQCRKLMKFIGV